MRKRILKLVLSGLMIGLSIVLTRIGSLNIAIAGIQVSRLGLGFLPIMLSSIILGPLWGMSVGALADLTGFFAFPSGGSYFPPITLTSALVGVLPFLFHKSFKRLPQQYNILITVALTQIICSIFIQTYWISLLTGNAYIVLLKLRAPVTLATIPVYSFMLYTALLALKKPYLYWLKK